MAGTKTKGTSASQSCSGRPESTAIIVQFQQKKQKSQQQLQQQK